MDLREWHPRQSSFLRDLLGPAAQAAALQAGYPLLPGAGDGRKPLYRYRLLLVLRRFQLWRLGGRDPGLATALDVAAWVGVAWCGFVLCIHADSSRQAAIVSRQGRNFEKTSCAVLDALLHGRDSGRHGRFVQSNGIVLCHSIRAAIHFGRKRRPAEPAFDDAWRHPQRRRASWVNSAQRGVAGCGRRREPAVYLRAGPGDRMVAMRSPVVDLFEGDVLNCVLFPVMVIEVPPLGWIHGETLLLHRAAQHLPVRALLRGATRVIRIGPFGHLVVDAGHLDFATGLEIV